MSGSIHALLHDAAEEVTAAREVTTSDAAERYLREVERLLEYHVGSSPMEPEAQVYPTPDSLDTVQGRLSEVIEDADEPTAAHVRTARMNLIEAILLLDERRTEGRQTSSWRSL